MSHQPNYSHPNYITLNGFKYRTKQCIFWDVDTLLANIDSLNLETLSYYINCFTSSTPDKSLILSEKLGPLFDPTNVFSKVSMYGGIQVTSNFTDLPSTNAHIKILLTDKPYSLPDDNLYCANNFSEIEHFLEFNINNPI